MKLGRIVKASDYKYEKYIDIPDEIVELFEKLFDNYHKDRFVIEIDPDCDDPDGADLEITIYDDYIE